MKPNRQIVPKQYTHNGFMRLDIGLTLGMMNRTGKQAAGRQNQPTGPWNTGEAGKWLKSLVLLCRQPNADDSSSCGLGISQAAL